MSANDSPTPVRDHLVDALYADLVGPFAGADSHESSRELLRNPSDWYLTGFLVPEGDREPPPDELEGPGEGDDEPREDSDAEDQPTRRPKLFPASMGLSVLLPKGSQSLVARVSFARYVPEWKKEEGQPGRGKKLWRRVPQPVQEVEVPLDADSLREVDTDQGLTKTYNALKDPGVTARSEHGERIVHLRELHLAMDRAVLEAYAAETGDPSWTDVEIPSFTDPQTPAERELHQRFEDHVLDKLFELNAQRAKR